MSLVEDVRDAETAEAAAAIVNETWEKVVDLGYTEESARLIADVQYGLSFDKEYLAAVFDNVPSDRFDTWFKNAPEEFGKLLYHTFEDLGYMKFDADKPSGKILDNFAMQIPPDENDMFDNMSPEAQIAYVSKWGLRS